MALRKSEKGYANDVTKLLEDRRLVYDRQRGCFILCRDWIQEPENAFHLQIERFTVVRRGW